MNIMGFSAGKINMAAVSVKRSITDVIQVSKLAQYVDRCFSQALPDTQEFDQKSYWYLPRFKIYLFKTTARDNFCQVLKGDIQLLVANS